MSHPFAATAKTDPAGRRRWLNWLGAALIVGTYVYLIATQPAEVAGGFGNPAGLVTLLGFLGGAVLLLVATLPALPTSTVVLLPVALALNVVVGQIVGTVGLPLYLDSIGTVLVAVLAGPAAGAATGALSNIVWALFNPTVLPFAAGAALIGFLAGWAARLGVFRRFYLAPIVGAVVGVFSGTIAAPIATFVFGGTSGIGTGAIVSAFRAMGDTLLAATTKQGLLSDPLDKAIVFAIVVFLVYALPPRIRTRFDFVRRYRVLAGRRSEETARPAKTGATQG
ncbi:ECF transporter S component [Paenarthrobacter sp. DKR-5]|uniref:ECF transporter S component n=1 Tax=Paenarthrobacter sp. DKR-5 TaxID=2835535 RepID=UPI001BDC04A5|nr:ECF transporter S component [Paenarthrobacter sp. DKR-5]MBT1002077.1 ECF transporter S component [Paenarthrobacter sp. DKR-5]